MDINELSRTEGYFKWTSVSRYLSSGSFTGTLFLVCSTLHKATVQWIADDCPDGNLDFVKHVTIAVNDIYSIEERIDVSASCSTLYILNQKGYQYESFEFTGEDSTSFITSLSSYVSIKQHIENKHLYFVRPKPCAYELPTAVHDSTNINLQRIQEVGKRFLQSILLPPGFEGLNSPEYRCSPTNPLNASANEMMSQKVIHDRYDLQQTYIHSEEDNDFQIVSKPYFFSLPQLSLVPRQKALTHDAWLRYLDREGRVSRVDDLLGVIYHGGIEPNLRPILWKYLLGYLKWENTEAENNVLVYEKRLEYREIKTFWKKMSPERKNNYRHYQERSAIIEKDVLRTDRHTEYFKDDTRGYLGRLYDILITYTFYNIDFGYIQGMNDLLAIIMTLFDSEEDAFWCFVGLMERLFEGFSYIGFNSIEPLTKLFNICEILMPPFAQFLRKNDSVSMNFCFKWLLIYFKREFSYDDTKLLWEVIWSASKNFYLLIAASILYGEKDKITNTCEDGNHILQYINGLSGLIDVSSTISRAQGFHNQLSEIENLLPKEVSTFFGFSSLQPRVNDGDNNLNSLPDSTKCSPTIECGVEAVETFSVSSTSASSKSTKGERIHLNSESSNPGEFLPSLSL